MNYIRSLFCLMKTPAVVFFLTVVLPLKVIAAPPSNDECTGAITRPSSTTCSNTQYDLTNATASAGIPSGCASVGTHYDVWFMFTATQTSHTVTVSSLGASITNPELQIFSGSCGALTSVACGTTFATGTGLTIGNVYYIRFSNVGSAVTSNGFFDLCITNSGTPPTNDDCTGAITLTSATSCNNKSYNMRYATASSGIPTGCASGGIHYDVWFKFTAAGTSQTVTINNLGNNINNPELQLFSGSCGSLTSLACGTTASGTTSLTTTGLTIGNTYYIRVSNIGSTPTSNGQSSFNICVTHPQPPPVNDDCSTATTLTSSTTCTSTTGNLFYATSASPAGGCGGATVSTTYDVWFKFVAASSTQAITVSSLGSKLSAASTYMELMSGSCGSLTSLSCQAVSTTSGRLTYTSLTVGNTYYVRVYVVGNPTATPSGGWNFNICLQGPPANDECTGAVTLTPGASCTNTSGTLDLATSNTTGVVSNCWAANTYNDVWYKFTATTTSHTITLNNMGSNLSTPRIQIYSGTCGALSVPGCATTSSLTQTTVAGTTYYVRVANSTNPSGSGSVANFNICITNAAVAPSNDDCSGAILLTSGSSCIPVSGTLLKATANGASSCINSSSADVWYRFVAQSAYPTIDLSNYSFPKVSGKNTPKIELYDGSGGCGALGSSIACGSEPLTVSGAGLTVGNTYYIRVGTDAANQSSAASGTSWGFDICITDPISPAVVDYSKSYVNITDGTTGGTIDPGDVLEIRATLAIQTTGAASTIDSIAFLDTLRSAGGFALDTSSISTRTNEGKIYNAFTGTSADNDAGWFTTAGAGTDTVIHINIGSGASKSARGQLSNTSKPSFYGGTCIIMATYRVTVNKGYGSSINFGGGAVQYRDKQSGIFYTINFPYDSLMVFQSPGSCQNSVSATNILGDEYNGSFGTPSGSPTYPQNRGTSSNTNYNYKIFSASGPNDYYYGIANNTSATAATVQTVGKGGSQPTRVFNLWDISGDHTNAINTAKGNPPCDLTKPISATNPCGYMMVVNASYKTDTAFQFNVSGACPNTYYEISAWFKNICYSCGCDSTGKGASSAGYIPTAPGDSSGVRPNIAVEVNGTDYYTTGDIPYQGLGGTQTGSDTLNNWVQKAFVYKTGPSQTSFTMSLRNNAPGGGGNDWAIDDIALKTCTPTMTYSPSITPIVCQGNAITITDTVRCYYNTYTQYKWQRSTDGGVTWMDVGVSGNATPTWNGSAWEYTSSYTVPPSNTNFFNDGDLYKLVVATTASNLSGSCSFSEATPITVSINSCTVLKVDLLSVSGSLENGYGKIKWVTSKEEEPVKFELQKSTDGTHFKTIAAIGGYHNPFAERNTYSFPDPEMIMDKAYYRVIMINSMGAKKYSGIVELKYDANEFALKNVLNPFAGEINFDVVSTLNGNATVTLLDQFGRKQITQNYLLQKGVNNITLYNTVKLSTGMYLLTVENNGVILTSKVAKVKN